MQFATITLELLTLLHIGAGECGMLLRSHGFVPGHLVAYALANIIGKAQGGQDANFQEALVQVRTQLRCGPLFILDKEKNEPLLPYENQQRIETHYLIATNHVALNHETRSSVEHALFEVEAISNHVLRGGKERGQPTRLVGGLWYKTDQLSNKPLANWLDQCWLGGEIKSGFGRVHCIGLEPTQTYPGIGGKCDADGIHLKAGDILHGPALNGVKDAPLRPWVGRLYDKNKGFGQRLSPPVLIRMDGKVEKDACFLPASIEEGFSCWTIQT